LAHEHRQDGHVVRALREKTSVKDVIESCGVPHPEVDLIRVWGTDVERPKQVSFDWQVQTSARLEVFGVLDSFAVLNTGPGLQTRRWIRFVADGHLGKLARNLRLLGLDTLYESQADDRQLLHLMETENRALLTRDRRLLMHAVVRHGYCPRSDQPEAQTMEILQRFDLTHDCGQLRPFHRCLHCNGLMDAIKKDEILERLANEPLTLRHYHEFKKCNSCGRIYWAGSHFEKLKERVKRLTSKSIP
jgi:uncharacterized protein with PIN domain